MAQGILEGCRSIKTLFVLTGNVYDLLPWNADGRAWHIGLTG